MGLGDVLEEIDEKLALLSRTRDATSTGAVVVLRQLARSLMGQTRPGSLSDDGFDEDRFVEETAGLGLVQWIHAVCRLSLAYLHGDLATALRMVERARALEQAGIATGHMLRADRYLYTCLTLAALLPAASDAERDRLEAMLAEDRIKLARLAGQPGGLPAQAASRRRGDGPRGRPRARGDGPLRGGHRRGPERGLRPPGRARGRVSCAAERHLRRGREALAAAYLQGAPRLPALGRRGPSASTCSSATRGCSPAPGATPRPPCG